jgi:hypothetical protein
MYTDPSGYFSLGGFLRSALTFGFNPSPKNTFNLIHSQPGQQYADNFIMTHQWAYAIGQGVATYYTAICGGCGGAAWSSYFAYQSTGSMSEAYRSGAITYATTYAFNYVNGANLSGIQTVAANGLVGGVSARLQGGSFEQGFLMSAGTSAAKLGWEAARVDTDMDSAKGRGLHNYNSSGERLTDGPRFTVYADGYSDADNNSFSKMSMADEGSGLHWYDENGAFGRFVNATSKVHDFISKWGYEEGNYVSRSEMYNTLFAAYSGVTMIPSAVFTATALSSGYAPSYIPNYIRRK